MIHILTGPVHSGKTTLLLQIARSLKECGFKIGGFLSVSVWKGEERIGYNLRDLTAEASFPYISTSGKETWQKTGPYYFVPEGLERAKRILLENRDVDLLIVDEVGPLELSGEGLWPALAEALSHCEGECLLVVRDTVLTDFLAILKDSQVEALHVHDKDVFARIMEKLTATGTGPESQQ